MKFSMFNFQFSNAKKWFLIGIIILAAVLRLWQLGAVPSSPDWDEVALGYNAYSIAHTGSDEYGAFLPVVLRSFDDYKPALYTYLAIPTTELFGLNVMAVRLPSAIFGILTVVAVYFLIKELFGKEKIALLASFLLAISPWHLQFSRIAFESNVGLSLNVFGTLFFLKSFKKPWMLFLAAIAFVASMYVYQSEKVFVPLLVVGLTLIFWKEVLRFPKKYIVAAVIFGGILLFPMAFYLLTNKNALARAKGVSVLSDQTIIKKSVERIQDDKQRKDYVGLLLDNRRIVYGREVMANYLSHFDFNWLFITGDLSRHHAPNMGLLYLWELPFLLIGIYMLLFGNFSKKTKILLFTWFLITPIPASVTTGVPHAVRALNFLPLFQVFTALGVMEMFRLIKNDKGRMILSLGMVAVVLFNGIYYLDQYFIQQPFYTAYDWQYGYAQAVPYVKEHEGEYKKIVVSNQPPLDQSYMFFLFYLKYPPYNYQKESALSSGGFRENHTFGKFEFRPIAWDKEIKDSSVLYVGRPSDFSSKAHIVKKVFYPNGQEAIDIVRGQ